jgi:hypothetical protein
MTEQDLERWEAFSKALGTTCYLKVEGSEIPVLIHGIYPMDYIEVVYKGEIVNFPSWAQRQSIKVTDLDRLRIPGKENCRVCQSKPATTHITFMGKNVAGPLCEECQYTVRRRFDYWQRNGTLDRLLARISTSEGVPEGIYWLINGMDMEK